MGLVFITGAGTEVGKTYVACSLLDELRQSKHDIRAFKPVATGMEPITDPAFAATDTARLLTAQGLPINPDSVAACTPWRFARPLSPDMAAAAEAQSLKFETILAWVRSTVQPAARHATVVVEGVGGVMSPVATDALNVDLCAALRCPAILVTGSYLGAINHALTAIEALRAKSISLLALCLSETAGSSVDFAATLKSLSRFAPDTRIVAVKRGEKARELADILVAGT
jgi:dethiobiotin synthetase